MKRILSLFLICIVALVSCNKYKFPTPTPSKPDSEPYTLNYLSGIYYGETDGSEECYNYFIAMSTAMDCLDVVTGDLYSKYNQQYLFLDLYASEPSQNYNKEFYIPRGTYNLDTSNSGKAGTIGSKYSYLFITDKRYEHEVHFSSCEVKVTDSAIYATVTDLSGTTYKYYTPKRKVSNIDRFGNKGAEGTFSNLTSDITIENCYVTAEEFGDYYVVGKKLWWLYIIDDATREMLLFELLTPMNATSPAAEYTLSRDLNNEYMALPGYYSGERDIWSWYYREDTNSNIYIYAPINSGKLTVEDINGDLAASFEVEAGNGNTISGHTTNYNK